MIQCQVLTAEHAGLRHEIAEAELRVIKVAETRVDERAVRELLKCYDAACWLKKTERHKRTDSELLTELAGQVCCRSFGLGLNPNITKVRENPSDYLRNILRSRHGSVLEHSSVTFAFLNASRVFTYELVRHRAGTAISQESLRYLRPLDVNLWLPADLGPVSGDFVAIAEEIWRGYRKLEAYFPWDKMKLEEKKRVTSALRRILLNGLAANVIWTANHRTIRWAIEMRTDPGAEIEIRKVFGSVAQTCTRDYPLLYGDFTKKVLGDGTFQYVPEFSKV